MELRQRVAPPKRYEPEEYGDMPNKRKPLFESPYVEFNPYLPPAAFPSLDHTLRGTVQSIEIGGHRECQTSLSPSPLPSLSNLDDDLQHNARLAIRPVEHHEINPVWQSSEIACQAKSCFNTNVTNYLPPVDFERTAREMETSDEERGLCDNSAEKVKRPQEIDKGVTSWGMLCPVIRLEILHGLQDMGIPSERWAETLGMSAEQWQDMITLENLRIQHGENEDLKAADMRAEINSLLLNGDSHGSTRVEQHTFQTLFQKHLGAYTASKADFSTTTAGNLARAHSFLDARRMPLSLAGEWAKPDVGAKSIVADDLPRIKITAAVETSSQVQRQAEKSKVTDTSNNLSIDKATRPRGSSPVLRKYMKRTDDSTSELQTSSEENLDSGNVVQRGPRVVIEPATSIRPGLPTFVSQSRSDNGDVMNVDSGNQHTMKALSLSPAVDRHSSQHRNTMPINVVPKELPEQGSDSSTIVLQPKRPYMGTAKPTSVKMSASRSMAINPTSTQAVPAVQNREYHQPGTGSSSQATLQALERMRTESMKRPAKETSPHIPTGLGDQVSKRDQKVPKTAKKKNFKGLGVTISANSAATPRQDLRKATLTNSAERAAANLTISPKDTSAPSTPIQVLSGSGSPREGRSPMAKRVPSRYRDDLVGLVSPTEMKKARELAEQEATIPKHNGPPKTNSSKLATKRPKNTGIGAKSTKSGRNLGSSKARRFSQEPPRKMQAFDTQPALPTPALSRK